MTDMIYKPLGKTGLQVSIIGFGAATLGNLYGDVTLEQSIEAVHYAIDQGVNIIDTSPYYGRTLSEERLGEALIGRRDKVIIATKAGRYDRDLPDGFDFSADRIMRSVEESMKRLKTDYLDIYQLHDIEFTHKSQILDESLPAMHKLKEQGKVRFIGVTGYPVHMLRDVISVSDLDVTLSYCHYNLLNTTLNDVLLPVVKEKQMGLMNASTLHMNVLVDGAPPDWHPAPKRVLETVQHVAALCRERGLSITTLALQFALQHPDVSTTVIGIRKKDELEHNLKLIGTTPDPELLAEVQRIIQPVKDIAWESGLPENNEPGALPQGS